MQPLADPVPLERPMPIDASDPLDRRGRQRRSLAWIASLGLALTATIVAGVSLGAAPIAPGTVWQVVGQHTIAWPETQSWSPGDDSIVWLVRMPRVLLGAIVGAGLGICGVAIQALVRNVLADPHLLGVTSGASAGAAVAILFGAGAALGANALAASAFAGALAAMALVFAVARLGGHVTSIRLVLAGVATGYALSALTSFVIFASDSKEGTRAVLFWLLGSLSQARWSAVALPAIAVAAVMVLMVLWSRRFDAISIGDDTAHALGVSPTRFRLQAAALVALGTGTVVAVSGAIGFVGLIVPHVARRLVGAEHRLLLPAAALLGAIFLVWADVVARVAFEPRELPLSVVTAAVGAPFLFILVRRFHAASE
jgi:iron complex transport system permease protein